MTATAAIDADCLVLGHFFNGTKLLINDVSHDG